MNVLISGQSGSVRFSVNNAGLPHNMSGHIEVADMANGNNRKSVSNHLIKQATGKSHKRQSSIAFTHEHEERLNELSHYQENRTNY